jgi:hypothetical protein
MTEPALPPARYEVQDVRFRFLLCGAALVVAVLLVCMFGIIWFVPGIVQDHRVPAALPEYPTPRLQSQPSAELQHFAAQELSRLNSSGWVDKSQGIMHIPIEEAMHRIVAQGIPDWPASAGGQK